MQTGKAGDRLTTAGVVCVLLILVEKYFVKLYNKHGCL